MNKWIERPLSGRIFFAMLTIASAGGLFWLSDREMPRAEAEAATSPASPMQGVIVHNAAELRRALEATPRVWHIGSFEKPAGAEIHLAAGVYAIDRPLVVRSGVVLRGAGIATLIQHVGSEGPAIEIVGTPSNSPSTTPDLFGEDIQISDLAIRTEKEDVAGIAVKNEPHMELLECCFDRLLLATGGRGIDLRNAYVQNCHFGRIAGRDMGAELIDTSWVSTGTFTNLNIEGTIRPWFKCESGAAITLLGSAFAVRDCLVEGNVTSPAYRIGRATTEPNTGYDIEFSNNSVELPKNAGDIGYLFEHLTLARIELRGLAPSCRARLTDCSAVLDGVNVVQAKSDVEELFELRGKCAIDARTLVVSNWPLKVPASVRYENVIRSGVGFIKKNAR